MRRGDHAGRGPRGGSRCGAAWYRPRIWPADGPDDLKTWLLACGLLLAPVQEALYLAMARDPTDPGMTGEQYRAEMFGLWLGADVWYAEHARLFIGGEK